MTNIINAIAIIYIIYINITTNKILFFNIVKINCFSYFIFSDFLCKYVSFCKSSKFEFNISLFESNKMKS